MKLMTNQKNGHGTVVSLVGLASELGIVALMGVLVNEVGIVGLLEV